MQIGSDVVVGIRYRILDGTRVVDATPVEEPWYFLVGAKECPAGLEQALIGKEVGAQVSVTLPPEQTYGVRNEEAVLELSRANLPGGKEPEVGMLLGILSPKGETELRVVEVKPDTIVVDANHPLAGKTLSFEAEVAVVRRASAVELLEGGAEQRPDARSGV